MTSSHPVSAIIIKAVTIMKPKNIKAFNEWQVKFTMKAPDYFLSWQLPIEAFTFWNLLMRKKEIFEEKFEIINSNNFTSKSLIEFKAALNDYEYGNKISPSDLGLRLFIHHYLIYNPLLTIQQKIELGI